MKVDEDFLNRLAKIAYVPVTTREKETQETQETRETQENRETQETQETQETRETRETRETHSNERNHGENGKKSVQKQTRSDKSQKKPSFWKTVHRLATEADKIFGLDKERMMDAEQIRIEKKIELDSASLEAHIWLNM